MMSTGAAQRHAWIRWLPVLIGLCVVGISIVSVGSWSSLASMPASEALAIAMLGLALMLATPRPPRATNALRWLLEIGAFGIGLTTIFEYATGVGLGLGQWLAPTRAGELQTAAPGRMSVLAASGFVLVAAALISERVATPRGRAVTNALSLCAGLVGMLALLGHLYGAPVLYRAFGAASALEIYAAIALLLLAFGVVSLHSGRWLPVIATGRTLVGTHVRWLMAAVVLIPLLAGAVAVQTLYAFGSAPLSIAIMAAGTTIMIGFVVAATAVRLWRMENRLAVSNRALAAAKQGVFIADRGGANCPIMYVNDAFVQITGYSAEQAIGMPCDLLTAGTVDASAQRQLEAALKGGTNVTLTLPSKRPDGTTFSARLSISVVPNSDDAKHLIGVIEDVTAEQLAAMNRLELLADASQARKEAENANRVKDLLFASVTHELRSPLNACMMWLDVLALGPVSEKSAKAIETIKRNLKIQGRLVTDLIDAAKISSGGIEINREPQELERLIENNVETWQLMAITHGVRFEYEPGPARHVVDVDSERLTQVLTNLVENAFGCTPAGGSVSVRVHDDGDAVAVDVEDTGAGLEADDLKRVFMPFWRAETASQSRKGLGLGLSIAAHLVEGHEGSLRARSEGLGKGSVFTVTLPLSAQAENAANVGRTVPRGDIDLRSQRDR